MGGIFRSSAEDNLLNSDSLFFQILRRARVEGDNAHAGFFRNKVRRVRGDFLNFFSLLYKYFQTVIGNLVGHFAVNYEEVGIGNCFAGS